jgi:hypothetical protein
MLNAGHSTIATGDWDPGFCERSAMLAPLRAHAARLRGPHWPSLEKLQCLLAEEPVVRVHGGAPLAVVRQDRSWTLGFEARVYLNAELQVRGASWHDLLNVLVWRLFPRSKAALNRAHYEALGEAAAGRRGPRRDGLTVFDESGLVVVSSDAALLEALRAFAWHDLLWRQRERVMASMRFVVFGHALYEKALVPYVGLTGHALLFSVDERFFTLPATRQHELVDERLAARLADARALPDAAALSPVPVLGVPGWWPANEDEGFYANERYFRRGRSRRMS